MKPVFIASCSLLFFGVSMSAAYAADSHKLLERMQRASQTLDYAGVFVYQHGEQLDSFRILHKAGQGAVRERLVSLNGAPREIVRNDREVRCYLPDANAVMVEHRRAERRNFPALLPESVANLSTHYRIRSVKGTRVAGRRANSVLIVPRDGYRYGYQMWADQESGLLLKAALVSDQGSIIEQYLFTQIDIGGSIPEAELESPHGGKGLVWHRAEQGTPPLDAASWEVLHLPPGYALTQRMMQNMPKRRQPVEHLVYSDGLAVISVFIEPVKDRSGEPAVTGKKQMGAMHAYGKQLDAYQITVVGEAPAATIEMIGESVGRKTGMQ